MKQLLLIFFILCNFLSHSQIRKADSKKIDTSATPIYTNTENTNKSIIVNDSVSLGKKYSSTIDTIPTIDAYLYKDIRNTVKIIDTTLNIQKYYAHNFLQKDLFGLLAFANDGMTYNTLDASNLVKYFATQVGFAAKQFSFLEIDDIYYYNVPTPVSKLFFRTAIKQGQNLDAFISSNVSKQTNLFVGYRGLRSLGAYLDELNSTGNFRIGGSYDSRNNRYQLKTHLVMQDVSQQENGGIVDIDLFTEKEGNRERLDVRMRGTKSLLKNTRVFLSQSIQLNASRMQKVLLRHQMAYNYYSYWYAQPTVTSTEDSSLFGEYYTTNIQDRVRNKRWENTFEASFDSEKLGQLSIFATHFYNNYYFNSIVNKSDNSVVPNNIKENLINIGGSYLLKTKVSDILLYATQSLSDKGYTNIKAQTNIEVTTDLQIGLQYQFSSKMPNMTARLYQSDFVAYNWYNNFKNEKYQELSANVFSKYINLFGSYKLIQDKVYFSNDATQIDSYANYNQLLISPKQYTSAINYFSIKAQKELQWKKWSLDNSILFQKAIQEENILNVPTFLTRNTLYYSDYFFDKALYLQGGISARYFSKYYMNGYNPLLGDFYVQNQNKIGNYPMIDVFLNLKIRTFRLYLAAEQVNYLIGKSHHFSAPAYPYKDLTLRLGLTWNFFN